MKIFKSGHNILSFKSYGQGPNCLVSHGLEDESPSERPSDPNPNASDSTSVTPDAINLYMNSRKSQDTDSNMGNAFENKFDIKPVDMNPGADMDPNPEADMHNGDPVDLEKHSGDCSTHYDKDDMNPKPPDPGDGSGGESANNFNDSNAVTRFSERHMDIFVQ